MAHKFMVLAYNRPDGAELVAFLAPDDAKLASQGDSYYDALLRPYVSRPWPVWIEIYPDRAAAVRAFNRYLEAGRLDDTKSQTDGGDPNNAPTIR